MIEIDSLYFAYGRKQVLHNINITLERGSITGLIGPNGAGKSTLMRCIAGLEIPLSGEVRLNGEPVLANPQRSYAQMGYLPDIFGMPERLTVAQFWAFAARSRGVPAEKVRRLVLQVAQLLHLEEKIGDRIGELSRGQKQRVGIGQVIIHHPKLLILDEPASGLDPEARYELSGLFRDLRAAGMTLLVSSHILAELDEYCTHMLVLDKGRVQQHCAVSGYVSGSLQEGKQPVVLRFAHMDDTVLAVVRQAAQLSDIHVDGKDVLALVASDDQSRVDLIRYLVQNQLPLLGVEPLKESLMASYLKNIKRENGSER